eukprot:COSAG04_NODE_11796_length_688_cov_0.960951_1_plen_108_part_01
MPLDKLDPALRDEHFQRECDWISFVAREYGLPVNWLDGVAAAPKRKHEWLAQCEEEGLPIMRQMIVRPQALVFSWRSRVSPFVACPTLTAIKEQPQETWLEQLSNPTV